MKIDRSNIAVFAALLVVISSCSHVPLADRSATPAAPQPAAASPAAAVDRITHSGQALMFHDVGTYKRHAAQQILRFNAEHTFSGRLPQILPAIVVLRITVDETGRLTDVWVQRSRNDEASKVAVAAITRASFLPRPFNLVDGPNRTLSFSETFLFNSDMRFQLRTLAPIQTPDQ